MNDPSHSNPVGADASVARRELSPQAQRALAEAEERRSRAATETSHGVKEVQGPKGLEPTRYGDWEHKGLCSDF
jgi:hypothetical protein